MISGVTVSVSVGETSLAVNQVSGAVWSIAAGDSLLVNQVSGSAWSTEGSIAHDAVDSGNPVKVGGQARTTNPTAVADADRVNFTADDLGRQVITPYQVRDLVATAYLALATGTETALLAGAASTFHDLVQVLCANTSDAAVDVDFRYGTAGSVIASITAPADATSGAVFAIPIPMSEVAQAITADMADVSGTTVNITATFIKNV